MLAKYINNIIKIANSKEILTYGNIQIINPREEDFIEAGYKELVTEEEPIYDIETEYLQPYYIEQEDKILQKWEVKKIEREEA